MNWLCTFAFELFFGAHWACIPKHQNDKRNLPPENFRKFFSPKRISFFPFYISVRQWWCTVQTNTKFIFREAKTWEHFICICSSWLYTFIRSFCPRNKQTNQPANRTACYCSITYCHRLHKIVPRIPANLCWSSDCFFGGCVEHRHQSDRNAEIRTPFLVSYWCDC